MILRHGRHEPVGNLSRLALIVGCLRAFAAFQHHREYLAEQFRRAALGKGRQARGVVVAGEQPP